MHAPGSERIRDHQGTHFGPKLAENFTPPPKLDLSDIVVYSFSHCGIVADFDVNHKTFRAIEGNSNDDDSRDGYAVVRHAGWSNDLHAPKKPHAKVAKAATVPDSSRRDLSDRGVSRNSPLTAPGSSYQ